MFKTNQIFSVKETKYYLNIKFPVIAGEFPFLTKYRLLNILCIVQANFNDRWRLWHVHFSANCNPDTYILNT